MSTKNFVVKNGLTVGNVTIDAATGNLVTVNATLGNLALANFFQGDGGRLSNIAGANISGNISGNISNANYASFAGEVVNSSQPNITSVGNLSSLTVTGNISANGLLTNNLYYANGNPWDLQEAAGSNNQVQYNLNNNFAASANFTFNPSTNVLTVSGNIAGDNVNAGNLLTANYVTGTLTTAAQPNVTSVGTLTDLTVTGNIQTSANLITDLIVGRTTSVSIEAAGSNQNIYLKPSGTGSVDVWGKVISNVATPVASTDAATKGYVDAAVEGLHIHAPSAAATPDTLATISGGTVTYNNGTSGIGATLTTTGSYTTIDGVNIATVGTRILVKNETNAAHNGIYVYTSSTVLTRADDFNTPTEMGGGDFTFVQGGTLYNDTGWVMTDPVTTVGTSPVNWVQFSGAGTYTAGTGLTLNGTQFSISNTTVTAGTYGNGDAVATFTVNAQGQLTNAANTAITANAANLTGTTLSSTIVNSSLTSVGTLGSLTVTGNATAGNVYANSGTVGAANLTGTLTTNAQPNITSVGTLTSLEVTGNANVGNLNTGGAVTATGNISANYFIGNGALLTGIDTTLISNGSANVRTFANANVTISAAGTANVVVVTGTGANVDGTLTVTGNVSGNVFSGNGSGLTALAGANVTGQVGNALVAGTVYTAAQPNITSVGTLSSLSVSGNVSAGNVLGGNLVSANFVTGTLTTAAQPNITSVGSLTSLDVTGNVSAEVVKLGGGLSTDRTNVAVTTNTVIDEFDPTKYRTAKYIISASGDNGYQSVETLLVHDNTTAYITIYGSICSNASADIVELTSNINGVTGNVSVYATSNSANALVNVVASYIKT